MYGGMTYAGNMTWEIRPYCVLESGPASEYNRALNLIYRTGASKDYTLPPANGVQEYMYYGNSPAQPLVDGNITLEYIYDDEQ